MTYMLDTNTCIYAIKNKPQCIIDALKAHSNDDFCISSITYSELMHGVMKSKYVERNHFLLTLFLSNITVLDYDAKAGNEYGLIRAELERKGTPIGPFDMLIAAHAKANKYVLVTNNEKEFRRVDGLKVENWVLEN